MFFHHLHLIRFFLVLPLGLLLAACWGSLHTDIDSASAVTSERIVSTTNSSFPANLPNEISYENATITEDITWNASVLVRGYLVVAPQATLKIEPGAVVTFAKSTVSEQLPRLVIRGRMEALGLTDQPILFISKTSGKNPGWEGILFLSSEKRNILKHVRIEGAVAGVEARFSRVEINNATIVRSRTGALLRDSVVDLTQTNLNNCNIALESYDSELKMNEGVLANNNKGIAVSGGSLEMSGIMIKMNKEGAVSADKCRMNMTSCDITGNTGGVRLLESNGQITRTAFTDNRDFALALHSSRFKISESRFINNRGNAISMDNAQSSVLDNSFEGNSGYNFFYSGEDDASAVRNWWGASNEKEISEKLFDGKIESRYGRIRFSPWLSEKPVW